MMQGRQTDNRQSATQTKGNSKQTSSTPTQTKSKSLGQQYFDNHFGHHNNEHHDTHHNNVHHNIQNHNFHHNNVQHHDLHHNNHNVGHCFTNHHWNHYCPPVVQNCFSRCYGRPIITPAPSVIIAEPTVITETVAVIDPAPAQEPAAQLPQFKNGDTVTLMFETPQAEAGKAVLLINDMPVELQIISWQPNAVTMQLPNLIMSQPTPAAIFIGNANGEVIQATEIMIIPAN